MGVGTASLWLRGNACCVAECRTELTLLCVVLARNHITCNTQRRPCKEECGRRAGERTGSKDLTTMSFQVRKALSRMN
jgi:hypothetical protein